MRRLLLVLCLLAPLQAEESFAIGREKVELQGQVVRVVAGDRVYQAKLPPVRSLEAMGDLDGDGRWDLFVKFAAGDSEVPRFGWLTWTGQELRSVEQGYFCPLNQRPGTFKLGPTANSSYWVDEITGMGKGELRVHIYDGVVKERNQDAILRLDAKHEFVIAE